LEVHAELNTQSKVFCGCVNKFGGEVNTYCCPICTGMPGTLPTLNEQLYFRLFEWGLPLIAQSTALQNLTGRITFILIYPMAYQISQFDIPICANGYLDIILDDSGSGKRIGITRIHIEEDAES
jgi:aspartyl-tRNA(Asn)/glutamyl-tRNA(Gln) amidotransferase subunit B